MAKGDVDLNQSARRQPGRLTSRGGSSISMNIQNLGYRTDCIFHKYNGEITERENYFLIRTPANPTFHWGNLLLFKTAPSPGDYRDWMQAHAAEFGPEPEFTTFGWDTE
ncbi:MAG: hypothetical protein WD772_05050, partial [Pseudohongiellaceae bacterium]